MYLLPDLLPELNELNDMIGLHKFKKQIVDKIIFFIQSHENNIMLHTVLEGAPGTGKTTVSNILAKIYSKLGIFKKPKFNIVRRADLISEYLGGTTIKTLETLERCKKGVMLIDEAYSIGSKSTNEDSYAKECIDTINQYLTENVDKIICIIAGYKSELDSCFFSINPGLRRRFPWTFTIENYTSYELSQIYFKLVQEKEWETSCEMTEVNNLIAKHVSLFTGNGGDMSNIIEKAMIINMRNNFGRANLYNINFLEFKEALDTFISTKKTPDLPPFGMYN
jgi:SpoVK/Ycf46/Vps4 family AAA+-type ATPase|tara:strand:- start:60860 stop:61699 length:840 start_codon:yes stop_codon:yes gene_type:complete